MESTQAASNPLQQVMQVATGYIASSALHVAVALNVADHLAGGPKTAEDLATATLGMPLFDYLAQHPDASKVFNDAMTALSAPVAAPRSTPTTLGDIR